MNPQLYPVVSRASQLIWEQVQLHQNLMLRSRVQDLLSQLQVATAIPMQIEALDGLESALRSDQDDVLIVARAHLSSLRGVLENDDLITIRSD